MVSIYFYREHKKIFQIINIFLWLKSSSFLKLISPFYNIKRKSMQLYIVESKVNFYEVASISVNFILQIKYILTFVNHTDNDNYRIFLSFLWNFDYLLYIREHWCVLIFKYLLDKWISEAHTEFNKRICNVYIQKIIGLHRELREGMKTRFSIDPQLE